MENNDFNKTKEGKCLQRSNHKSSTPWFLKFQCLKFAPLLNSIVFNVIAKQNTFCENHFVTIQNSNIPF